MDCKYTDGRRYSRALCPNGPGKTPATQAKPAPSPKPIIEPYQASRFERLRNQALELLGEAGVFKRL